MDGLPCSIPKHFLRGHNLLVPQDVQSIRSLLCSVGDMKLLERYEDFSATKSNDIELALEDSNTLKRISQIPSFVLMCVNIPKTPSDLATESDKAEEKIKRSKESGLYHEKKKAEQVFIC